MPTYVAFLRAINLGATRKFPKDCIRAATEAAGGCDVETYINTGNVRLVHRSRSAGTVQKALEQAYAAEAGFDVPTIVFTAAEMGDLAARIEDLGAAHDADGSYYITLYATAPAAEAAQAVHDLGHPGERCVVDGRAAHVLLDGDIHTSKVLGSKTFKNLGQGTARTHKVLRTVAEKWCRAT